MRDHHDLLLVTVGLLLCQEEPKRADQVEDPYEKAMRRKRAEPASKPWDVSGPGAGHAASYLLESGSSYYLMEDGSSTFLLE